MLFCRCRQITARRFVWLGVLAAIPTLALGAETPRIQGVYSNIAMTPSEDYQGMEVIVSLTDTGYYAVLQCASGADATRPVVVPVKVDEERGTLACACTTPRATTLAFSSPQGHFGMVPCELSQDDPLAPAEFHFVHRGAGGDTVGVLYIDRGTLSATVDETEPKFWDGHIMTLDLPQERGGVLLIANWTGVRFANSVYRYMIFASPHCRRSDYDGLRMARWCRACWYC